MVDLTLHWTGYAALGTFGVAYLAVVGEERLHLRKSIPVLVAAGLIWVLVGTGYSQTGHVDEVAEHVRENLLDFAELFLFLIVAMTYVNTLGERGVFDAVRVWLVQRQLSLRGVFWVTGVLAFLMSPIADNLTTALVMGAVVLAVGRGRPRFVTLACINVVVAANAGGAFSPFGDVTTLMVWQAGIVEFPRFFLLLLPSFVNWIVPAVLMSFAVEHGMPEPVREAATMQAGALVIVALFLTTIATTVILHGLIHLPPAAGMMIGLGVLKLFAYVFNQVDPGPRVNVDEMDTSFADPGGVAVGAPSGHHEALGLGAGGQRRASRPLQTFAQLERVEWDTLMFFYGVMLGVGGLGALGYLRAVADTVYAGLGATWANVMVGLLSAVIDNVPIMFAVLTMRPEMSLGQWLLVTLAAGVGGSLLSIGSAAGVALMGLARGVYTFQAHLRWSWAIGLGYAASLAVHLVINAALF